ncbi:MAG: transcription antitermination factor NusB [Gammaproteobacteria bacterium]|nr:MAG: transcription antitermination factor NusB [Gammaproteobacteria bacterium]
MNEQRAAGLKARRRARECLVQALYQHQLTGHDAAELRRQFAEREPFARVDQLYFDSVLEAVLAACAALNAEIDRFATRGEEQLDPVARAILWIGLHELSARPDVPERVAINEAVELSKRFGPTDSHRFVNALLDRARLARAR